MTTPHPESQDGRQRPNPFNADLVAALDSPRYTGGEHRIAFSDQSNGVEGNVYGKTLEMALARAAFIAEAVNTHSALSERVRELEEDLKLSRDQTRRQGEISRQTLESVQAMDGLHKRIVREGVETHKKLTATEARCAAFEANNATLIWHNNTTLAKAIMDCLSYANGRQDEWGDRAMGAFSFLESPEVKAAIALNPQAKP